MVFNMKRTNNLSETLGLDPEVSLVEHELAAREKTERDRVCELIFVKDPRTGLPCSDIGMYMNPSTPPQVKDYIQQNIFGEGRISAQSTGVDDDTIAYLTRHSSETSDEYVSRVNDFMMAQKKSVQDAMVADHLERLRAQQKTEKTD